MTQAAGSPAAPQLVEFGTPRGRWVILAAILGSGIAFLDSTVVNVALPHIGDDLGGGLSGLQWTLDGYLLTLSALLLLGGALGDEYGRRRMFVIGLVWFTAASVLCGLAPSIGALIAARALQGAGGALLVPGSLALITASFRSEDHGSAIGAWSGLTGVATSIGPFLGGWLVDAVSWRLVFLINVPLAALALWVTLRHVPESHDPQAGKRPDFAGAIAATLGLTGVVFALIQGPAHGWSPFVVLAGLVGLAALVAFPFIEMRVTSPLVPLDIFKSRQFSGANATTFVVYAALGVALFLVVVELQTVLGYSALEAGTATLPITVLMLVLSPRAGRLSQRIGPRIPMTIGPLIVAAGLVLLAGIGPSTTYFTGILPGLVVFGLGLSLTVAPLTAAVMGSVEENHVGVGSGVNNAVARVAGLLAVAVLPALAGLETASAGVQFSDGVSRALYISAALAVLGALNSWITIRKAARVSTPPQSLSVSCQDPCVRERQGEVDEAA
ncbi:MAG TPA: DHA2 family efflux MFS transporter permease subunit [Acidimicrobiia bacterium]|nr:DHA2 family efflux MFS transporter permease subunit [Acidimicrobiia bacterium]